jgi:hypothetical protein
LSCALVVPLSYFRVPHHVHHVHHAAALHAAAAVCCAVFLREPRRTSADFHRPMFDAPLKPTAVFNDQLVDYSWGQSSSMQPMFAMPTTVRGGGAPAALCCVVLCCGVGLQWAALSRGGFRRPDVAHIQVPPLSPVPPPPLTIPSPPRMLCWVAQRMGRGFVRATQAGGHDFTQTQAVDEGDAGALVSSYLPDGGEGILPTQATQGMLSSLMNEPMGMADGA